MKDRLRRKLEKNAIKKLTPDQAQAAITNFLGIFDEFVDELKKVAYKKGIEKDAFIKQQRQNFKLFENLVDAELRMNLDRDPLQNQLAKLYFALKDVPATEKTEWIIKAQEQTEKMIGLGTEFKIDRSEQRKIAEQEKKLEKEIKSLASDMAKLDEARINNLFSSLIETINKHFNLNAPDYFALMEMSSLSAATDKKIIALLEELNKIDSDLVELFLPKVKAVIDQHKKFLESPVSEEEIEALQFYREKALLAQISEKESTSTGTVVKTVPDLAAAQTLSQETKDRFALGALIIVQEEIVPQILNEAKALIPNAHKEILNKIVTKEPKAALNLLYDELRKAKEDWASPILSLIKQRLEERPQLHQQNKEVKSKRFKDMNLPSDKLKAAEELEEQLRKFRSKTGKR